MSETKSADNQLYSLVRAVEIMGAALPNAAKTYEAGMATLPATFAMHSPDGSPCLIVEMYLLERAEQVTVRSLDGGSLKVTAGSLSQLVRYCGQRGLGFLDLDNAEFDEFVTQLVKERHHLYTNVARRNNDTVNRIVDTCIEFFRWLQKFLCLERPIVGSKSSGAQIWLTRRRRRTTRNADDADDETQLGYRRLPRATTDPKPRLSRDTWLKLWDSVALRLRAALDRRTSGQGPREAEYLKDRRELMLLLLQATGCRPGELARMRVDENVNCVSEGKVVLVTLKSGGKRRIPLELGAAIKLDGFISRARAQYLAHLRSLGRNCAPSNAVFLDVDGSPLNEIAITKDFKRLVSAAGIQQRICMSMFRHRFVTTMVKLHLKAFMEENPTRRWNMLTQSDYRSVLLRVAKFTGHKRPESLLHYVDWAWEELGIFDDVGPASELCQALNTGVAALKSLVGSVATLGQRHRESRQQFAMRIVAELEEIQRRTQQAMDAVVRVKGAATQSDQAMVT